jgi:hypothetical protein
VALLLEGEAEPIAFWLAAIGMGVYVAGTRVFLLAEGHARKVRRIVLVGGTCALGLLGDVLSAHEFLWLLAAWAVGLAVLTTISGRAVAR